MKIYLLPIIRKEKYRKKKRSYVYDQKLKKKIIVSKFLIPIGRLCIPNSLPNYQLF